MFCGMAISIYRFKDAMATQLSGWHGDCLIATIETTRRAGLTVRRLGLDNGGTSPRSRRTGFRQSDMRPIPRNVSHKSPLRSGS